MRSSLPSPKAVRIDYVDLLAYPTFVVFCQPVRCLLTMAGSRMMLGAWEPHGICLDGNHVAVGSCRKGCVPRTEKTMRARLNAIR